MPRTASEARQFVEDQVHHVFCDGGCTCAGCMSQVLGIYPVTSGDIDFLPQYRELGPPTDPDKVLLFNALIGLYNIEEAEPAEVD